MIRTESIDPDKIREGLQTRHIGSQVVVFDSTSSTNHRAAQYGRNPDNHGLAIFAEQQEAGRGRAGHRWLSPPGAGILCSIVLIDSPLRSELLSLTAAVALAEAIGGGARIKWPNDILLNGKKVSGILLDASVCDTHRIHCLGIGINCHQGRDDFPESLRDSATSLDIETGLRVDRVVLAKRLLAALDLWMERAASDEAAVVQQWQQASLQLAHRVTLCFNGERFTGNCIGVDPQHGLILQLDHGGVRMFEAAHSSIVKE